MKFRTVSITDDGGEFIRCRQIADITTEDVPAVTNLYRDVYAASKPAPRELVIKELTAMSIGMARRKDHDTDFRALLVVYANDLAEYPSDVIADACKALRRENRFFPTISEMRDACEERFEFRRSLSVELRNIIDGNKRLAPPDPRAQMHYKELSNKRDWLPCHWEWYVSDADKMIEFSRKNGRASQAEEWEVERDARKKSRTDASV